MTSRGPDPWIRRAGDPLRARVPGDGRAGLAQCPARSPTSSRQLGRCSPRPLAVSLRSIGGAPAGWRRPGPYAMRRAVLRSSGRAAPAWPSARSPRPRGSGAAGVLVRRHALVRGHYWLRFLPGRRPHRVSHRRQPDPRHLDSLLARLSEHHRGAPRALPCHELTRPAVRGRPGFRAGEGHRPGPAKRTGQFQRGPPPRTRCRPS
jgi:hypothetical protein